MHNHSAFPGLNFIRPAAALFAVLFTAGSASAQTFQILDPSLSSANWNTSTAVWSQLGGFSPYNLTWQNGEIVGFQNTTNLTLTVTTAVTTAGLQFGNASGTNVNIGGSSTITMAANAFIYQQIGGLTATVSAPLAGSNGVTINGPQTGGSLSTLTLSGANTYTGTTFFSSSDGGSLLVKVGVATTATTGAFGAPTNDLTLNATTSTVDLNGFALGVGGLSGSGPVTNSSATAAILTAGNGNATGAYSGLLSGKLGLTKAGSGMLTLSGPNTNNQAVTVSAGTLAVTNATGSATGTGTVSVGAAGTLIGTGTISGTTSVASGGDVGAGTLGTAGRLTFGNGLTLTSGATFHVDIGGTTAGTNYDQVVLSAGTANLASATLSFDTLGGTGYTTATKLILLDTPNNGISGTFSSLPNGSAVLTNFGGFAYWTLSYDNSVGQVFASPLPEPGSMLGIAAAALGLVRLTRRRRNAQ